MAYFPFLINIEHKKCLVVGGGNIAAHKVGILLQFGVSIQVVAPEINDKIRMYAKVGVQSDIVTPQIETGTMSSMQDVSSASRLTIHEREFESEDLKDCDLVVVATDDCTFNHEVATLCRQKRILVNTVDQKEDCDFIFPAMIKEPEYLVTVSSEGRSPLAVAELKKKIMDVIPDYYGELVANMGVYRDMVLEQVADGRVRKQIFQELYAYGATHDGKLDEGIVKSIIEQIR